MEGVGVFGISGYGLLVALGFIVAYGMTFFLARKNGIVHTAHIDNLLVWALIPAVIGARALFVLYHFDYFSAQPGEIIAVWHGGWVWHGGLLGGILGTYVYCRRAGIALLSLLDILAPCVAFGQAVGRWGNFLNQEAYGLPTNLPWAITIDPERRLAGYESFVTFHPTFLYESIFTALLSIFLTWVFFKNEQKRSGFIFFLYLFLYSCERFFVEFLRIDTVPVMAGLRAPQWISLGLIVVSIVGLARVLRKQKKMVY